MNRSVLPGNKRFHLGEEREEGCTFGSHHIGQVAVVTGLVVTRAVRGDRIQIAVHTLHSRKGTTIAGALVADVGAHLVSSVAVRSPRDFLRVQPLAVGTLAEIPCALRG